MPPFTRSRYRRQQEIIANMPDIAYILPKLYPAFEVDPMYKPRVKKRKKFADRESREAGLGQEWSEGDANSDVSDWGDIMGEPSFPKVATSHYKHRNWKGETFFYVYGSEEMKKAVAAKKAKQRYQERTRGVGRTKARRTWRKLRGPAWLRDAKGRWCHDDPNVVLPAEQVEDGNENGDEAQDENEHREGMKEENGDGHESEDLYDA